jgi:hypothetical protein
LKDKLKKERFYFDSAAALSDQRWIVSFASISNQSSAGAKTNKISF